MKKIIVLTAALFALTAAKAQDVIQNKIYNPNIKTLQLYPNGFELSAPFLDLNSGNSLQLSFDELGNSYKNYQYTLIQCNADWTPTSLLPQQYLDGYYEDYISSYQSSFNTRQDYVHYSIAIPNENIKIKKSGNYIVKVYEVGSSDAPTFTYRFVVYENRTSVKAVVKRSDIVQERDNLQEIDFTIIPPFSMPNPFTDLKAVILQNNRWDNAILNLQPTFVRESDIVFNYDKKSSFPAGNEYRYVDLRTVRFQTERVAKIVNAGDSIKIKLINDPDRSKYPYTTYQDNNGQYIVANQDGQGTPQTDGDYAEVTFTLPHDPISYGVIYLDGAFTLNTFTESNQMKYNYDLAAYQCKLMLKQGLYNYQYVLVTDKAKPDPTYLEGTNFMAENNYTILLYYRDFSSNYDRVIGCYTANSFRGY